MINLYTGSMYCSCSQPNLRTGMRAQFTYSQQCSQGQVMSVTKASASSSTTQTSSVQQSSLQTPDTQNPWEQVYDEEAIKNMAISKGKQSSIFTPYMGPASQNRDPQSLPIMLYLPGIDGTGLAAYRQFTRLSKYYDVKALSIPTNSTESFEDLMEVVKDYLQFEASLYESPGRQVYIMGESFGAVLALAVAAEYGDLVDRVVIVNPATSFSESVWPTIGPLLGLLDDNFYNNALPFALMPILSNPVRMLLGQLPRDTLSNPIEAANAFVEIGPKMLSQLSALPSILPKRTLIERFKLLHNGNKYLNSRWPKIKNRVLCVIGSEDNMLPGEQEAKELPKLLARCRVKIINGAGHAMLQEAGIDLAKIIENEGFYVPKRRLSSLGREKARTRKPRVRAVFGEPGPIELPTDQELFSDRYVQQPTGFINNLCSPVFVSRRERWGELEMGLGPMNDIVNAVNQDKRPVLLIGNHQIYGADLSMLVPEVYSQTGVMVRGLSHPVLQGQTSQSPPSASQSQTRRPTGNGGPSGLGRLFYTYGATTVSASAMCKLLSMGESVLLFPGGSREASKSADEQYRLFWPTRPEFVRIAAKYGARIIPFGAIGLDEAVQSFKPPPALGTLFPSMQESARSIPRARQTAATTDDGNDPDTWASAVTLPSKLPSRVYFLFQAPIEVGEEVMDDSEAVTQVYNRVKSDVEGAIVELMSKRDDDLFNQNALRVPYEAVFGRGSAPSFKL